MKICKRCHILKALSHFTKKTARKDGLDDWCIECNKKERKKYYEANKKPLNERSRKYHRENKEVLSEKRKKYYDDNIDKKRAQSLEYYHSHKEEKAAYAKNYHAEHKDRLIANNREWKANNPKKIYETRKIYTEKNREKIKITSALYRKNHRDKIRTIKRNYLKKYREKVNESRRKWASSDMGKLSILNSRHKRRYLKRQTADGSIPLKIRSPNTKELQELLDKQKNICYRPNCNTYISRELGNIHLDHMIPLEKGGTHTLDNVAWSCSTCNLRKGTTILEDD